MTKIAYHPRTYSVSRLNVILGIFLVFFSVVVIRLFYLQIVRHEEFLKQAHASQIKSLTIEAQRGSIYAFNHGRRTPLVINQRRWTMFSDTIFIEDLSGLIGNLRDLGLQLSDQQKSLLASGSRYVVLQKGITDQQREHYLEGLKFQGVYFQKQNIRRYVEGRLGSQVLGFLNEDSQGQYGVEQQYDRELTGTPGRLHVTTDARDTPLLFVQGNVVIEPVAGQDITLTLDVSLQSVVEEELKKGIVETEAQSGSVVVLNARTGAVLAMAGYPDFDPGDFKNANVADYVNDNLESTLEPASTMKVLLMAAALNEGVVAPGQTYYNPRTQTVDGFTIANFINQDEGYIPVENILSKSLNTGTIEMLKRLGDDHLDDVVDASDRRVLYDYFSEHFYLQQQTGINLPNEVTGQLNPPDYPWSPNHLYATMTFGQSLTVTPLQIAAAYAAIFNGGDYYRPYVTAQIGDQVRQPTLVKSGILDQQTILDLRLMMQSISQSPLFADVQYTGLEISAKTGTAQIPDLQQGGYLEGEADGLMAGYIKSGQETLVVVVVVARPQVVFGGSQGAGPIWKEIVKRMVVLGQIY